MPQTARRRSTQRRPAAAAPVRRDGADGFVDALTSAIEQVQRQLSEALEEIRLRTQAAADDAQERAAAAGDLARKLALASVGAVSLAQEEIAARLRRARS